MFRLRQKSLIVVGLVVMTALPLSWAAQPQSLQPGNSYHMFTSDLAISSTGVVAIPSVFRWSVETSWRGVDAQGHNLPDERIMLRLHDPEHNFTAFTAQIDLDTAEKLQRELADLITRKRQDPDYQYRPQLYDSDQIPTGRITGSDQDGNATISLDFESRK